MRERKGFYRLWRLLVASQPEYVDGRIVIAVKFTSTCARVPTGLNP